MIPAVRGKAYDLRNHPAPCGGEPSRTIIDVMDRRHAAPTTFCALTHIRLCEGLTAAEVQDLERIARMQDVHKRQPLYRPGDPSRHMYLLTQGRIKLAQFDAKGKVVTLEILEPGDVFGDLEALEGGPRETVAEALDHAVIYVLPWEDFRTYLAKYPPISLKLTQLIGARLKRAYCRIKDLVCRNVEARLARLLIELRKYEESRGIRTPLTHQEMANVINCTRETVSNTLGRFRNQSLIRLTGRTITIVDDKRLSTFSDDGGSIPLRCTDHREEPRQAGVQSPRGRHRDGRDALRGADTLRS